MTDTRQDQTSPPVRDKRNFAGEGAERNTYAAVFGINSAVIGKRKAAAADMAAALAPVTAIPQRPAAPPPAAPLRPDWSGGVGIKELFKGDPKAGKIVGLVKVGGQDFVLKGAPRSGPDPDNQADRSTAADNAEAAQLFRKLGLKGVRAPNIRVIAGQEKADMLAALQATADGGGAGSLEAASMITVLKAADVQLSGMDPGINLDQVFMGRANATATSGALKIRRAAAGDSDKAWADGIAAALKTWKWMVAIDDLKSSDPAARRRGLAMEMAANPPPATKIYLKVLEEILDGRQAEGLQAAEDEAVTLSANQAKLASFTASPEGMEAYAGVALIDLVSGMEDRIAKQWNGGNFLFDPTSKEFSCIDNNKETNQGLTEANPAGWTKFLIDAAARSPDSLSDAMFSKVYEPNVDDVGKMVGGDDEQVDRPAYMPGVNLSDDDKARGKAIFADVLQKIMATIENDPDVSPAAKTRVAVMKEFERLRTITAMPPALVFTGAVEELKAADKVARAFKGVRDTWFADADKIKSDLRRNPANFAQARARLDALIAANDGKADDRLAQHIRFLATASEFAQTLGARAAAMTSGGNAAFPAEANGKAWFDKAAAPFSEQADNWLASLRSSDGGVVSAVQASMSAYAAACDAVRARAQG